MDDFSEIPDKESIHQIQTVLKACKTIQMEMPFTQEQIDCIEKYFHFLYGIGYFQGTRSISRRKRVLSIGLNGKVLKTFESALEASSIIGVHKSTVAQACKFKYKCQGLTLVWESDFLKVNSEQGTN